MKINNDECMCDDDAVLAMTMLCSMTMLNINNHDRAKRYGSNCRTCIPRSASNSSLRGSSCDMAPKTSKCPKRSKMPLDLKADMRGALVYLVGWRENSIDRREHREDDAGYGLSI